MHTSVCVIVDVSGSMNEMGKILLQRNLCRFANQLKMIDKEQYADVDIKLIAWGQNTFEIEPDDSGEVPAFVAEGTLNFSELCNNLSKNLSNNECLKVLILSDGNFEGEGLATFASWKSVNEKLLIRTVAIGADANLFNLKKVSSANTVFDAENIASAINAAIWGSDVQIAAPETTSQIQLGEAHHVEDAWDA